MNSYIKGKKILAVDDEEDILDTIEDILDSAKIERAIDYKTASQKIKDNNYDLVILDIMGVEGLTLLEEAVEKKQPTVMLTAHAVNPETIIESIRKGAIAYLPKETLSELEDMLEKLLGAKERGEHTWKILFEELDTYFKERFGDNWKEENRSFWKEFERSSLIGRGIQKRIMQDDKIRGIGI